MYGSAYRRRKRILYVGESARPPVVVVERHVAVGDGAVLAEQVTQLVWPASSTANTINTTLGVARFIDASIYRDTFPAIHIAILFFTIVIFLF